MKSDQKTSFVLVEHARGEKQAEIMKRIHEDGVCPFCPENFLKYHTEPIIKETSNWIVTYNYDPYEGAKYHFLFVYKPAHIDRPSKMLPEARIELFDLIEDLSTKHDIDGGSILMRFGDGLVNGSSVDHLHAHLVVGERKSDNTEGLKVKLGYKKVS